MTTASAAMSNYCRGASGLSLPWLFCSLSAQATSVPSGRSRLGLDLRDGVGVCVGVALGLGLALGMVSRYFREQSFAIVALLLALRSGHEKPYCGLVGGWA